MEKNKLDKLFQDKFAEREFEFQNSYWERAEALIEAAEQGRRKRRWAWIFGILLLVVFAAFGWYFKNTSTSKIAQENLNETFQNNQVVEQNSTISANDRVGDIIDSEIRNEADLSLKKDISEKQNSGFFDENSATEKTTDFIGKTQKKVSEKILETNQFQAEQRTGFTEISNAKNNTSDLKSKTYEVKTDSEKQRENTMPLQKSAPLNNDEKTDKNDRSNSEKPLEKAMDEVLVIDNFESVTESNVLAELNFLNQHFALLNKKNELNRRLQNINIDENRYPLKSHRWQLQATAGVSVIPNPKMNDNSLANIFGGLTFGYKITPNLTWQTGLIYQVIRLDSLVSEGNRQIGYAFGKQDDLVYLQTNQLHFLELPVLVGYQTGKMRFSAGLEAGRLLAARGKTQIAESQYPFDRTDEENADFNLRLIQARENNQKQPVFRRKQGGESGWLAMDNFKAWQFSLVGKYQFQVSPKFDLGIGLEYRLNQHYLKNEMGNNTPLSIQFFTTYRIFN